MKREDYLKYRNKGSVDYVWEWYVNTPHKEEKLGYQQFWEAFSMWPPHQFKISELTSLYDEYFNIVAIQNLKTNTVIRYV